MTITEKQAQRLKVKSRTRWSPYLEKCCLLLSANESYQRADQRLDRVETLLWKGKIDEAIHEFADWKHESVDKFINYLNEHRGRIVNYDYFQTEGISIGSGAIESSIKRTSLMFPESAILDKTKFCGRRIKISGAQWNSNNISQVLRHRCAYLNGNFSA